MSSDETIPIEFYHGAKADLPQYFESFVLNKVTELSRGLREGDEDLLVNTMRDLAKDLPKDNSFKELAVLLSRRKDGGLFITLVKGGMDQIDSKKASELLDDLVQGMPVDIEQLFLIHSHPCGQTPIGPAIPEIVGWSQEDTNFIKVLGGKLKIFPDLNRAFTTVTTANSNRVALNTGQNLGRAFGWSFPVEVGK